jgi:hypothetical protein
MNRVDLLHLIRAACDVLEVDEVVVLERATGWLKAYLGAVS